MSRKFTVTGVAALLALAIACSRQAATPTSPSASAAASGAAAADGSTLKVSAPVPVSPINDQQQSDAPTLAANAASTRFGATAPGALSYRFQVFNPAGTMIADSGAIGALTYRVSTIVEFKARHTWRVRAEYGNDFGPWSATASFISSEGGYIRGNEVFDPLYGGTTVGQVAGPVTFSGEGAKLESVASYIRYAIPQTITTGEFAVEIKGLRANAPGDKSKVFGMMQGNPDSTDYITNPYRVDVQYRGTAGSPPNAVTYRVLYGSADDLSVRYEPTTEQRLRSVLNLDPNTYYYWRYRWGTTVRVTVQVGGPTGPTIYDVTRNSTNGSYNPRPMYAFIGTPTGRSGAESASIPGTIYRNVWISTRPRP
ncbi:MAG TPA: hypothetical protein VM032_10865 [Vicinamibacterales bacterium]|nr:hypothetical protein [Vicinamibacterales bacterium]